MLKGDPLLSVREDAAEQCWTIIEPTIKIKLWKRQGAKGLEEYPAGSAGPVGWDEGAD